MGDVRKDGSVFGETHKLDMFPFTPETFWKAGRAREINTLGLIVGSMVSPSFAVTDVAAQEFVDKVRRVVDSSKNPRNGMGLVHQIMASEADGGAAVLKRVLELGVDPDLPDAKGWRPSHVSACYGRRDFAAALLLCRPNMSAVAESGTPLDAAEDRFMMDVHYPQRMLRREGICALIRQYRRGNFPKIAELASKKKWFAVKNLVRRQLVSEYEFIAKFESKSAMEWAQHHKEGHLAKELEYYAALVTSKLLERKEKIKMRMLGRLSGKTVAKVLGGHRGPVPSSKRRTTHSNKTRDLGARAKMAKEQ